MSGSSSGCLGVPRSHIPGVRSIEPVRHRSGVPPHPSPSPSPFLSLRAVATSPHSSSYPGSLSV
ncbi:hypothetical protein E2C01_022733 [Portunus trituberculatus]|uniref:Uncharacterized protein n=1 Tax=Portunus trituberculatus TaxID=210409 RepID=A0A5B7E830_PORTR|nr:hypothetical protein [Portunus trituberculatus]